MTGREITHGEKPSGMLQWRVASGDAVVLATLQTLGAIEIMEEHKGLTMKLACSWLRQRSTETACPRARR
jgi:hypothetical protein